MSGPNLLLVNPGPERKRPLLEAFARLPVTLFVLSSHEERWLEELIAPDQLAFCNVTDKDSVLAAAAAFQTEFDGIGSYYEPSVLSTAYAAQQMGLRGPSLDSVAKSSISKVDMRVALKAKGIATPGFAALSDLADLPSVADSVGYPCVLKPASGADSQSVRKIESHEQAVGYLGEARKLGQFRKGAYWIEHDPRWLVEEYLEGTLLAVDGYVCDEHITFIGAAETELGPEPHFNIEVNWIPPRLTETDLALAREETERVVRAIDLNNAAFHAEFRMTATGPRLVEIAARLAGGVMPQGYQQAYGINLAAVLAELWLGRQLGENTKFETYKHVLQRGVFPSEPGVLMKIEGIETARNIMGVFEFSQVCNEGEPLALYPDASVPVYYYGIVAHDHTTLLKLRDDLESCISWTTGQTHI